MPTLYAPGTTPIAVTPHGFAALEAGASAALLARVRALLADGRGLGGVIEALTGAYGASLTAIPAFAVALADADGVRVAVRGGFSFDIGAPGGAEHITGAGVTTWTERVLPGAARVTLITGERAPSPPAEFEIGDGIVLAAAVVWDAAAPVAGPAAHEPSSAASAPPAAAVPASPATASVAASAPVASGPNASGPVASGSVDLDVPVAPGPIRGRRSSAAVAPPAEAPSPDPTGLIDSGSVPSVVDAETLLPSDSALSPHEALPEGAATTGYDELWGATVIRSVESAEGAADATAGAAGAPAGLTGDHDGATISLAQARALRDAAAQTGAGEASAPLDSLAPPRPPAPGRLRVSTGQVITLDRTVVIGRRPRSTRVSGTDLPHLVAVDSPQQDISRSHVELRVEGESIVATDLHTTNGTTLLRAGADPVRLHPGEGTVVVPGDILDLGDGITVVVEGIS
ncbi:FHA domain-containing protein [Microbacterium timonense]|uniref:FHA domain-containing protein n=1 Tax=Microbacterium timonense TaxID=2086576 RepID=UPI000D104B66|nr:FHA domain-containing protein [Microbacterium timonense]